MRSQSNRRAQPQQQRQRRINEQRAGWAPSFAMRRGAHCAPVFLLHSALVYSLDSLASVLRCPFKRVRDICHCRSMMRPDFFRLHSTRELVHAVY